MPLDNAPAAVAPASDLELSIVRVFDAPRSLVFRAWTDPAMARRWAGPRRFTATHIEGGRPAPGVAWRTCLRNDETGEELWQGGVYREVVEPELLSFTFAWDGDDGRPEHEMLITIDFSERDGKTEMTFRQAQFASKGSRDSHDGGWSSAFDRLAETVAAAA